MASADAPIIALDDARRSFDDGRIVGLAGVTLRFRRGELVALCGASGSGKSTLINLISGLDLPTGGTVSFDGRSGLPRAEWTGLRASRIGLVFQDFNLIPTLTAAENVETALFGRRGAAERKRIALERLAEVGIGHCAGRLPPQLSGGERRRVAIARGLANEPEVLLADEPTSNLDTASGAAVIDLLLSLHAKGGVTMIIVSHDETLIARCPRRIRLSDGRVVRDERDAP